MKFLIFQHVPYESPGFILEWIRENNHTVTFVNFYDDFSIPVIESVDALIIMGGPMNIYEEDKYPFLAEEKDFINKFIHAGRRVLGICLGSQMVADVFGGKVKKNVHAEIGWFPVKIDKLKVPDKYRDVFPETFTTLHWHGDTFDLPENATGFISSAVCTNQAFIKDNVAAFQFHPEMTPKGVNDLVHHNEAVFEKRHQYIQSREDVTGTTQYFEMNKSILHNFLDRFFVD